MYIVALTQDCFNGVQVYEAKAGSTRLKDNKLVKCISDNENNNIIVTLDFPQMLANHFSQVVVLE